MTREEAIQFLDNMKHEEAGRAIGKDGFYAELMSYHVQALNIAIKALDQEPCDFAKWVATEIFDDNWEYNKGAFEELACRKLAKMGIVKANGDKWELVDPQESEEESERGNDK